MRGSQTWLCIRSHQETCQTHLYQADPQDVTGVQDQGLRPAPSSDFSLAVQQAALGTRPRVSPSCPSAWPRAVAKGTHADTHFYQPTDWLPEPPLAQLCNADHRTTQRPVAGAGELVSAEHWPRPGPRSEPSDTVHRPSLVTRHSPGHSEPSDTIHKPDSDHRRSTWATASPQTVHRPDSGHAPLHRGTVSPQTRSTGPILVMTQSTGHS